jgi:hypothetical protein
VELYEFVTKFGSGRRGSRRFTVIAAVIAVALLSGGFTEASPRIYPTGVTVYTLREPSTFL